MKIPSLLLTISAMALTAAPALAGNYSFNGDTTGGLTFNRPTDAGDALSLIGTEVPHLSLSFTVSQSGSYNLSLNAVDPGSYDTFMHLYSGSFNPSSPLDNFFAANDDAPGGSAFGSALTGVSLTAGNSYVFVLDGFGNTDFGAFNASISGLGDISINSVPEPSVLSLGGFAGMGLLMFRQRLARR